MKNKIQLIELIAMLYFIMRSAYIGIGINSYLYYARVDAYIGIMIGTLIGLLPLLLFIKMTEIDVNKDLNENIINLFGKKIGIIIVYILVIAILLYASVLFYDIINFITSEYLFDTPPLAIALIAAIPIIYILSKGIKTICRVSIIVAILSIILFLFSIIGLTPIFRGDNLLPFLENGIAGPIKAGFSHTAYVVLPSFVLTIVPRKLYFNKKSDKKKIIISYLLINLLILGSIISVIGVLGIDLALLYQYPSYQALRRIKAGGFIQRTESILAIQWVLCLFMMISFCLYYVYKSMRFTLNIKSLKASRILIVSLVLGTVFIAKNIFHNSTQSLLFITEKLPFIMYGIFFLIPLIIYIKFKLTKKAST